MDFVKSIKSLVNENCSLLKKGKAVNDWKCLLDYPNIQDNDTLTVFSKSSKGTGENVDLASLVHPPVKKDLKESIDPLKESREFLRELNLLLEKYKIKKEQVIHLLQKD